MEYISLKFNTENADDTQKELLIALLDSINFEGITEEEKQTTGYIPLKDYNTDELNELLTAYGLSTIFKNFETSNIKEQNWNAEWEKNFSPIVIDTRCAIRAPFHDAFDECTYQITIEPKMSFGTGHHETTRLIIEEILEMNFDNKSVLDMGCGTGILAILAQMKKASEVTAIDYDKWAYENTVENCERNNCADIEVILGGKEVIPNKKFDIIIANINRNILVDQLPEYIKRMHNETLLLLSGILVEDFEFMINETNQYKLKTIAKKSLNKWGMMIVRFE